MRRLWQALVALVALVLGRRRRHDEDEGRIVPAEQADRRAETAVILLLFAAGLCGVGFVVVYAFDGLAGQTQLLGIAIGLCLGFLAAALIVASKGLVANEEIEEEYPPHEHPEEQEKLDQLLHESASPITRKKLLATAAGAAGGGLLLAAITPALSFGPWGDSDPLFETPWRRGRRLVDEKGKPLRADDIEEETFYTAYPEGASKDEVGSPLVLVRVAPSDLRLPPARRDWAPGGIVAFSKICTHAACAVSLYRKPKFAPVQPRPALVCPCHYSTFDPARAGKVLFGPAGRPLPQLPLVVDPAGELRAGGPFSGPVGPSWHGVRERKASS